MVYNEKTYAREVINDLQGYVRGKTVLVTGGSPGGIGAHLLEAIARSPAPPKELIIAVRDAEKGQEEAQKIRSLNPAIATSVLELDLASFKSVRNAASEINRRSGPIDVLVNNAGVMAVPYSKTEDGHEMQFQANHLGSFLLTNLIMDKILGSSAGGRVVMVGSDGYRLGHVRYSDYGFHDGEHYDKWAAYGQSKTAQMLFSIELARRYGDLGLQSYSVHPGVIMSTSLGAHIRGGEQGAKEFFGTLIERDKLLGMPQAWEGLKAVEPDQGVATQALAAFSPRLKNQFRIPPCSCWMLLSLSSDDNGSYLHYCQVCPYDEVYPWALGEREAAKCWQLSEKLVGQSFGAR